MSNEAKHTPGPWVAYNAIGGRVLAHWRIRGGCVRNDPAFAVIDSGGKLLPEYEAANARLIAAAPDLLAVCERIKAHGTISSSWIGALDAALAKARGEAR